MCVCVCVCVLKRVRVAVQWPRKKFQMLRNSSLLGIFCVCVSVRGGHENSRKTQTHHKHTLPNVLLHIWTNPHLFTDSTHTRCVTAASLAFIPEQIPTQLSWISWKLFSVRRLAQEIPLLLVGKEKKKASGATLTPTNAETSSQKETIEMKYSADCEL